MKKIVRFVALLVAAVPLAAPEGWAQTPTLEFAPGAGNPTGNGPVVTDQLITLQNNPDNPTGNTFAAYSPTTTATFVLSGQAYSNASGGRAVMFGGQSGTGNTPDPFPLFPLLNFISGSADANYTAANIAGTGISTTNNSAVALFSDVRYLGSVAAGSRFRYAELTISFSQPMVNPVLHVTGLGSIGNAVGFTTELELLSTGVTLTRLSGSDELVVNSTQILNSAGVPNTGTGNGAASGSVRVNTSARGITQLQLRLFVRIGTVAGNPNQNQPNGSWGDGWLLSLSKLTPTVVSGTVFEDVNYGGGAGRPRTSSGAAVRAAAVVELYDEGGSFVATTTTDANGQYAFTAAPGTYTLRVVNSSVTSSRTGYASSLRAVQTYNGTTTRVGGERPSFTDAAANAGSQTLAALTNTGTGTTPQSLATVNASGATTTGPDFGFNFDVVVNTNNAGQGSLRQFILNSNALGGENALAQSGSSSTGALPAATETSIFMIPDGQARPGLLAAANGGPASQLSASGVAVITPTTVLDAVTGPATGLDGSTQTFNIGNTNDRTLGAGGQVGTTNTALGTVNGPEVQLTGTASLATGLNLTGTADNSRVIGLAVFGFGNQADANGFANVLTEADNVVFERNVLGSTAISFGLPTGGNGSPNVRMQAGTGLRFANNLIGFSDGTGLFTANGTTSITITNNEIRGNARLITYLDGVDAHGSSLTVTGNLFIGNAAQGFDSFSSTGSNVLTGNTFSGNGVGNATSAPTETAAIRIYGSGNTVARNVIAANYGAGVAVVNGATATISENSIFDNGTIVSANNSAASGQIGIDLLAASDNEVLGTAPFVTINDSGDGDAGGNGLLNFPIITSAIISGNNIIVQGFARAGATIELFATGPPDPRGFGEGRTFLGTFTEGTADNDAGTGSYAGTINGQNQGGDNASRFSFTIPRTGAFAGLGGGQLLTSTATVGASTSEFSGNAPIIAPLTGFVYEDVNYGGGAGRSRTTLGTAASSRAGAKVELYNSTGGLAGTTVTDANGQYFFSVPTGSYTVRVVNNSVLSGRTGASAASGSAAAGFVSNQLAVQTFNGTTTRVGGENPALADAAPNPGSQALSALTSAGAVPQSIATFSVGAGATNDGPDFGFNFDVVVNTNNAGQGSLRQFILNSNALGGEATLAQSGSNAAGALPAGTETSIFMIPDGQARAGLLAAANGGPASQLNASGVAVLTPTAVLPIIAGPRTSLDGTTQTRNINNSNAGTLGAGGTVGTAATALATVNRPEVQLVGNRTFDGLVVGATNAVVRGLSLYGFDHNITVNPDITAFLIEQNIVGTSATSFADPGVGVRTFNEGILLDNADNGTVRNNLLGYNGGMGVWVLGTGNGSNGNSITGNEIRGNAQETRPAPERLVFDGLELQGTSTGNTVSGNLITANYGNGIDTFGNTTGGNTITGNTISGNGVGVATNDGEEGSGLRIFGAANPTLIQDNVLSGNNGSGVLVSGGANTVRISRNSTFNNTRLAIDLLAENTAPTYYNGFTGTTSNVTINDSGDGDSGANGLLNFPVITGAAIFNGRLLVEGFARPGVVIELFTPGATANSVAANAGFGQGQTFLGSFAEGSADDIDNGTGAYSGTVNGLNQGADNTNRFRFSIPLTGNFAGYAPGARLTSTATAGNSTSEFSGNVTVGSGPLPVSLISFTVKTQNAADALLTWATASELNNERFEVERSLDGKTFEKVGQIAGHGTTAQRSTYTFTDAGIGQKASGLVYYRLRQVDTDGSASNSPVRTVRFGQPAGLELSLYPSPATDILSVRLSEALPPSVVTVFDMVGKRMLTGRLADTLSMSFEVRPLPAGTYLVQVKADNGQILTRRFVKN